VVRRGYTNFCANAARLKNALVTVSHENAFSLIACSNSGASSEVISSSSGVRTSFAILVTFLRRGEGRGGRGGDMRDMEVSRWARAWEMRVLASIVVMNTNLKKRERKEKEKRKKRERKEKEERNFEFEEATSTSHVNLVLCLPLGGLETDISA